MCWIISMSFWHTEFWHEVFYFTLMIKKDYILSLLRVDNFHSLIIQTMRTFHSRHLKFNRRKHSGIKLFSLFEESIFYTLWPENKNDELSEFSGYAHSKYWKETWVSILLSYDFHNALFMNWKIRQKDLNHFLLCSGLDIGMWTFLFL